MAASLPGCLCSCITTSVHLPKWPLNLSSVLLTGVIPPLQPLGSWRTIISSTWRASLPGRSFWRCGEKNWRVRKAFLRFSRVTSVESPTRMDTRWVMTQRQCGTDNRTSFLLLLVSRCSSKQELALFYLKGLAQKGAKVHTFTTGNPGARARAQHKRAQ